MLKYITIILSIIVMALSLYSLIYPNDDSLLFLIMEFAFPLLGLFLGLFLLKEKNKVPAILCFSALGFWLVDFGCQVVIFQLTGAFCNKQERFFTN